MRPLPVALTWLLLTCSGGALAHAHLEESSPAEGSHLTSAPETLVLEIKPGPYRPNEFAPWAPEEGEPTSGAFVHWAADARVGSKWRSQGT